MAKIININNGTSNSNISNGNYNVTASATGYDNLSINPATLEVVEGQNNYEFTIGATGTLVLHVTENGQTDGTPVVGATFNRTDAEGTIYGDVITTDSSGNATFNNVPFAADGAPTVYYKQITSDGSHDFDDAVKNIVLTESTTTFEVTNTLSPERVISLTDQYYNGLPIENAEITLE